MAKPSINASLENLRSQMARGAQHGAAPGSSGNVMAGANMRPAMPARAGATSGLGANPSRVGQPAPRGGDPMKIAGSPAASSAPTADSVRSHSLALGGLKHMVAVGHIQPHHAKAMEAKSRAHIAAYGGGAKKAAAPQARRFGSLGGSAPAPAMKPDMDQDGY